MHDDVRFHLQRPLSSELLTMKRQNTFAFLDIEQAVGLQRQLYYYTALVDTFSNSETVQKFLGFMYGRKQVLLRRQYLNFQRLKNGYTSRHSVYSDYYRTLNKILIAQNLKKDYLWAINCGFTIEEGNPFMPASQPTPGPSNPSMPEEEKRTDEDETTYKQRMTRMKLRDIKQRQSKLQEEYNKITYRRREINMEYTQLRGKFRQHVEEYENIRYEYEYEDIPLTDSPDQSPPGTRSVSRERGSRSPSRSRSRSRSRSSRSRSRSCSSSRSLGRTPPRSPSRDRSRSPLRPPTESTTPTPPTSPEIAKPTSPDAHPIPP